MAAAAAAALEALYSEGRRAPGRTARRAPQPYGSQPAARGHGHGLALAGELPAGLSSDLSSVIAWPLTSDRRQRARQAHALWLAALQQIRSKDFAAARTAQRPSSLRAAPQRGDRLAAFARARHPLDPSMQWGTCAGRHTAVILAVRNTRRNGRRAQPRNIAQRQGGRSAQTAAHGSVSGLL